MILKKSKMQKLISRIGDLLSSDRFWINVGIGVMTGLQQNSWKIGVITALGLIVGVGTIDRTVDKVSQ